MSPIETQKRIDYLYDMLISKMSYSQKSITKMQLTLKTLLTYKNDYKIQLFPKTLTLQLLEERSREYFYGLRSGDV